MVMIRNWRRFYPFHILGMKVSIESEAVISALAHPSYSWVALLLEHSLWRMRRSSAMRSKIHNLYKNGREKPVQNDVWDGWFCAELQSLRQWILHKEPSV